jgi:hypothetical protein
MPSYTIHLHNLSFCHFDDRINLVEIIQYLSIFINIYQDFSEQRNRNRNDKKVQFMTVLSIDIFSLTDNVDDLSIPYKKLERLCHGFQDR